ncbi:MAG: ClcB-like voltage-gated chloride channel protein [Verrucomicrobia bacterium]|nr:ClcB-like voltage-gated chloride channel protein [Verrucomicrobiota bacterium]
MSIWLETAQRSLTAAKTFVREHWQYFLRLRERLRFSEETFHLLLAGLVGMVGGFTNVLFYLATQWAQLVSLRRSGDLVDIAHALHSLERLFIPLSGGLAAGFILGWGLRWVGPQGSTNILEVVVAGDGKLPMRTALIKAFSSLVSIATGASIGREGSITQLTATLASKGGQLAGWHPYRLRLMVACGVASGLAAAYNAPVAGAIFAAQIVLGNFSMSLFAPLVFASVVATMVSRSFFGIGPWYRVPAFDFPSLIQLPWFVFLGALAGVLGASFLKMLHYSEEAFGKLRWPLSGRLALGGCAVGALAVFVPEVWGNGYSVTNRILHGELLETPFPILFLTGIFLAKLLGTVITVGSGAVGGVFTPTLFLGAGLGSLFGLILHQIGWATDLQVGAFALVGMGSVLAATIHSPLLAVIMIFEISLNYSLMPPLMLGCVVATLVARRFHAESIYTEPLRRKGLAVERESQHLGAATMQTVGDLMREPVQSLRDTATFREIADRFLTCPNNFLPVVDAHQKLLGVVALQDMKEYLNAGQELNSVIAYDVMRPPPSCLTPNQKLLHALPILLASELKNIPVINNPAESRLVGNLVRAEALALLSEAIANRTVPAR